MPWGWECKAKWVKQKPVKPTKRRGAVSGASEGPSPYSYDVPEILCGKGYSKIKRAPAYTFGGLTPGNYEKPVLASNAAFLDVCKLGPKGQYKIKHGIMPQQLQVPRGKSQTPGPGSYASRSEIQYKRPPAYTMRPAARPPYVPKTEWKPPPNMYLVKKLYKTSPAYSFGNTANTIKLQQTPNPGDYRPKFNNIQKRPPGFSFGAILKPFEKQQIPAPNLYCEKKFMYPKPTIPSPSFGIRHSEYLGKVYEYIQPSNLNDIVGGD